MDLFPRSNLISLNKSPFKDDASELERYFNILSTPQHTIVQTNQMISLNPLTNTWEPNKCPFDCGNKYWKLPLGFWRITKRD